jgi:phage-related protein
MGIKHSLSFNGINTADYGVYISGEGVFDAPNRSVEMVSIPGRDGDLALDNGRFENIEVKYPAFVVAPDLDTFTDTMRELRNMFCSQKGYMRLADSFNPNEYRLGIYKSGLEVDVVKYNTAASFELVFDCEPFRYLMSGESEIEVTSGDKIANPTPFESKPLIEVEGYGAINIGEYEIELDDAVMGDVDVTGSSTNTRTYINTDLFNVGDALTAKVTVGYEFVANGRYANSFSLVSGPSGTSIRKQGNVLYVTFTASFTAGTSSSGSQSAVVRASIKGTTITDTITINATVGYHSAESYIYASSTTSASSTFVIARVPKIRIQTIADSTIPVLGHPTYIDCDIGQAYRIVDGEMYSLDAYIDLGSDLPILDVGETEITFDSTMTSVKIIPRWKQI